MAFSGALTLSDLNDFITPSQACIKPVEQVKTVKAIEPGAASTEIMIDNAGAYYEVTAGNTGSKLEQAQISLNDCLACSGCITSAESVLITLQSHTEVLNVLQANPGPSSSEHKIPVLSIAPQSLASLAATLPSSSATPIGLEQVYRRIEAFAKKALGFEHVFDTTFARHLSLKEHAKEFAERKQGQGQLPMLASACPGWVCYAEKAHSEMLPFISSTKSPQQVMGSLVKNWLGEKWGKNPDQIYHVTVMPCYDKKLEASRQDFHNELYSTRDVDCVITTGELELLMKEKDWDLRLPVEAEEIPRSDTLLPELIQHPGSSSGSYLESLVDYVIESMPMRSLEHTSKMIRNADYREHVVTDVDSGQVVFKGATCYGFRNLQNVVRKIGRDAGVQVGRGAAGRVTGGLRARIKARKGLTNDDKDDKSYDYVEVMACPSGCVNGGGQIRPPSKAIEVDDEGYKRDWAEEGVLNNAKWGDKAWTARVESAYWIIRNGLPTPPDSPGSSHNPTVKHDATAMRILKELCHSHSQLSSWFDTMENDAETLRRQYFRTQYHAVETEIDGLAVKW